MDAISESDCPAEFQVYEHVPMAHVADVETSIRFYALLGFHCDMRYGSDDGSITNWASLRSGGARLFLSRGDAPIVASQQAVLFYMYSKNIAALRQHLQDKGLSDAGRPPAEDNACDFIGEPKTSVFFDIQQPFYMPAGELRVHDPDGYCVLIGQPDD